MIHPINDYVLLELDEGENSVRSKSINLVLPDGINESRNICTGTVLEVGRGLKTMDGKVIPLHVSKGMKVAFDKYASTKVKDSGKDFYILKECDILAVIDVPV